MLQTFRHLFTPHSSNNHRPKLLHTEGLFVLTTLLVVLHVGLKLGLTYGPLGNVLGFASDISASQVLEQTNTQRAQYGLSPLTNNAKLSAAAAAKATNMFQKQYWAHVSPDGIQPWKFIQDSGYAYSVAGENLARDFGDTTSMVNAWMNSPTHKANILHGKYTEIGVAVVNGQLMGVDTTLVVQMFGAPTSGTKKVAAIPKTAAAAEAPAAAPKPAIVATTPLSSIAPTPIPQQRLSPPTTPAPANLPQVNTVYGESFAPRTTVQLTPTQFSKISILVVVGLLFAVTLYDGLIAHRRKTMRVVGKNIAHLIVLATVAALVFLYRGGSLI